METVPRQPTRRRAAGVVVICAAHFLIGLDGLAVAVALPALQRDLAIASIDGQWVLSAYGLAFGGSLLLGGRVGDLDGRRRALTWGLSVFATGALVAGSAPGLGVLIGGRVRQGLGAAAAVPAALALIGSLFAPGPERTGALSALAAMSSVGTMSGLLLGGAVTDLLGWRWVFFIAAPMSAAAALAARFSCQRRASSTVPCGWIRSARCWSPPLWSRSCSGSRESSARASSARS